MYTGADAYVGGGGGEGGNLWKFSCNSFIFLRTRRCNITKWESELTREF